MQRVANGHFLLKDISTDKKDSELPRTKYRKKCIRHPRKEIAAEPSTRLAHILRNTAELKLIAKRETFLSNKHAFASTMLNLALKLQ